MRDFEVLYRGKYVSLVSPKDAAYECLHEIDGVLILPIVDGKIGIRQEYCPPYFIKDPDDNTLFYTVMSGGKDAKDKDCVATAIRELKEEGGVTVVKGKAYRVFENRPYVKNTDSRESFVVIKVDEYEKDTPKGDGTSNEKKSKTLWVTQEELLNIITKPNCDTLLFWLTTYLKATGMI